MLDISSINAVSGILAALGVIVGVALAILELRNITRTRQMELIMGIYTLFTTQGYQTAMEKIRTRELKNYDEYVKEHGLLELMQVAGLFEGLGFLLYRKFLDVDLVRELMSESIKMAWEKVKPMVEDARKQIPQRKSGEYIPVYQWWEYLYNEMQKREQRLPQKTA
jgi:hypothetical protein